MQKPSPSCSPNNRSVKRDISYLEAENSERVVSYDELYERALGILFHLQKLGAKPGDKLIIYLANNEQFLDAFWAGMLGGIVPVPVALGISDEHKHKLLRIAKKLGKPFIYTDRKTLDRIGAFAGPAGEQAVFDGLLSRAFFAEQVDDISKAGKVHAVKPDDMAFIQFSSGSTSEPKGIVLTHRNILVNSRGAGDGRELERDRHLRDLDAADPRHGPHRHAHHDVRAPHERATSCRRSCSSAGRCCG